MSKHSLPWWNRIKFKLLVFGVIMSIVPISIFGWYNIQISKSGLQASIQERQLYVVQRAASEVNNLLSSITDKMELLVDTNDISNFKEDVRIKWEHSLYGFLKQNNEIENAYVFDRFGNVISSASRWDVIPPSQITSVQYKRIKLQLEKNLQSVVGEVHYKEDGSPYVNMGIPFYSSDHKSFSGGMIVEVSLRSTFKKVSSILTGKNGYIFITDDQSNLIAHTDFSQVLLEKDVVTSPELEKMINNENYMNKSTQYKSYTGKDVIGVYAPIAFTNWGVVIEQPVDQAYIPINILVERLFMTMLIVIFLVVLVNVTFGVWFTKPIELMERAVRKVSSGILDAKIDYDSRDEFGKLSEAFNHMTKEIQIQSEQLKQEKEQLDTIINGSGAGFALINSDYQVEWMNPRLSEWMANGHNGMFCYSLLGRLQEPCKDCPITLRNSEQCQNEVINTIDDSGEIRIYRHRMYPLEHTLKGEPEYLIVVEDITEQRQLEEMVIQADKLSALGILASGFAHEVNNPLASISVYAEDLKERIKEEQVTDLIESGEIDRYLNIIRGNVDRCKMITNNLLNFSRKTSDTSKNVDLAKLIDDSLILLHHVFKKKQIKLVKKIDSNIPNIIGDDLQIQQVLVNLMQNSVDAMKEKGTLEIFTVQKENKIEIHIQDDGCGMTKEQILKAFDPFYTTKPVGKGTGLGLYISYNIIKKLNGDIKINSQENIGTDVIVILPNSNSNKRWFDGKQC